MFLMAEEEWIGFVGSRRPRSSTVAGGVNGRVPGMLHPIEIMEASRTTKRPPKIKRFSWINGRQSAWTTGTETCMDGACAGAGAGTGGYNSFNLCNYFERGNGKVTGMPDMEGIMGALGDSNIYMIGLCGKDDDHHMCNLFDTISRRVTREDLFGVIVMVSIRDKPDFRRIQQEIAHELGFSYRELETPRGCIFPSRNENAIIENAKQLSERIQTQPKILFILHDLHTRLDLAKLGIPFGVDHNGCKLILTSQSIKILSDQDQMNVQRIYRV